MNRGSCVLVVTGPDDAAADAVVAQLRKRDAAVMSDRHRRLPAAVEPRCHHYRRAVAWPAHDR